MPSYERWIRKAKQALKDKNNDLAEDIKSRFSHDPSLWDRVLKEYKEENKPKKSAAIKKAPTKKTATKKVKKVKKDE